MTLTKALCLGNSQNSCKTGQLSAGAATSCLCTCPAGLGGSVLEAKTNRTSDEVPHIYCTLAHDWQVEWLSVTAASRPDCFLSELNISYSPGERL